MPSPSTTDLPRPKSWDEFEDICADLLKQVWQDPYVTRNGRTGQKQHGVDIYGYPKHLGGKLAGAQCKKTSELANTVVDADATEAAHFQPTLSEFIIMTTAKRDAGVQQHVRETMWPFDLRVMFWEDISLELSGHDDLLSKHFPGWRKKRTTRDDIVEMLMKSNPSDYTYDDSRGEYYLNSDIKLRIVLERNDRSADGGSQFHDPWAKKFPDPEATRQRVYIYYEDTHLSDVLCVWVDGRRHLIPVPLPTSKSNLAIDSFKYHVGAILNYPFPYNLDDALRTAGILVLDS